MFSLFGGSKNYSIGIDFGTSAIKVVELFKKNQKIYLDNYGWADLGLKNPSSIKGLASLDSQSIQNENLQKYLEKLVKSMKLKSNEAYISLPGFSGLITVIEFPDMDGEELEEAIRFEARKYIPISLDEVALDWEIIGSNEAVSGAGKKSDIEKNNIKNGDETGKESSSWNRDIGNIMNPSAKTGFAKKRNEILLVAAPKSEVMRCGDIVEGAGLKVKNVELELFSLVRSLVGNDAGCFLIIDIGSRITNIILVEKGNIRVSRNIEGGGSEVTNAIADSLNISKQRAEELKKENKDFINNKEMSLAIPVLDMIANESIRIINAFKEKNPNFARIDGVILSGGCSKLQGIDKYFDQKIGIQTSIGNPWKRVICDEKMNPFIKKLGTSFSVALGVAFRGLEEAEKKQ